jgi:predicted DNA-binding transcriptional regulator YafY
MSVNKYALIRYQVLDRCFRNPGRNYFIEDLLEECNNALAEFDPAGGGIQKRQLYDDIAFMESEQGWSIPLDRIPFGRRVHYRYVDLKFSINNQPLNQSEAMMLQSALMVLSRFTGTPQFEWVNQIIPTLEDKFGLKGKRKDVIAFDSNIDLKGLNFIKPVFDAVMNQQVLHIDYKDFKSPEPYRIVFHPYYLRQYNNRWFAFGLNPEHPEIIWNLALDRIQSVNVIDNEYLESETDWDDYFYDIIGVTRPQGSAAETIVLRFSKAQAPYIITKPIHPSQKMKKIDTGVEISVQVIPNFELERLILSFSERVEVISPLWLRERIADFLLKASGIYSNKAD